MSLKYHALDTPSEAGAETVPAGGERTMATFYRPESHRPCLRAGRAKREASLDQVLTRLLLHLGAGLQVGRPTV